LSRRCGRHMNRLKCSSVPILLRSYILSKNKENNDAR
jgi:hypothetical protein